MEWSTPWRMENFCFFSFRHGVLHGVARDDRENMKLGGRKFLVALEDEASVLEQYIWVNI